MWGWAFPVGTETSCREESSEVKVKVMVITPALMPQPSEVTTGPDVLRDCTQFSLSCMLPGYRNPGKHWMHKSLGRSEWASNNHERQQRMERAGEAWTPLLEREPWWHDAITQARTGRRIPYTCTNNNKERGTACKNKGHNLEKNRTWGVTVSGTPRSL